MGTNGNCLLYLSIRFSHPVMDSKEVIDNIGLIPSVSKVFDKKYLEKIGKLKNINGENEKINYITFRILETNDNDIGDAIKITNSKLKNKNEFLNNFIKTGGEIYYYLTVSTNSENKATFELKPEIIKECMELGITIGVEVHSNCDECSILNEWRIKNGFDIKKIKELKRNK
jgi:hypothetical protein